jgi:ferredoxin
MCAFLFIIKSHVFRGTEKMIIVNAKKCPQDHKCPMIKQCPEKAISQKGVGLPVIDPEKCIECLVCVENCPREAFEQIEDKK